MTVLFPVDESYLVAAWLESFLWGLYTVFYGINVVLILRRGVSRMRKVSTCASTILYLLATAHMAVVLKMLINAFIVYRDTVGPVGYYEDRKSKLYTSTQELYISSVVVGDAVVVWRLYVVWGKRLWIAALPMMLIIGTAISGYGAVSQFLTPHPVYETAVAWATAMYAITLTTNIVVTTVTAARIWYVNNRNDIIPRRSRSPYFRVFLLIIESGLFLAAIKIVEFALYRISVNVGLSGDHSLWIVLESIPQIMGIIPTLIFLAINSGITPEDDYYASADGSTVAFARDVVTPAKQTSTMGSRSSKQDDETTSIELHTVTVGGAAP